MSGDLESGFEKIYTERDMRVTEHFSDVKGRLATLEKVIAIYENTMETLGGDIKELQKKVWTSTGLLAGGVIVLQLLIQVIVKKVL